MRAAVERPLAVSGRSDAHRYWVLALVFAMMASNYIDRSIVGILAQPIKEEFRLSDFQVGLLGGFAFAVLYMFLGLPVARLAERYSRVAIISIAIAMWSAMTTLCGAASSYLQLLLLRVGVGVGEAGASPPAQSLLADYFPPDKRASALAVLSLGIPIGGLAGNIIGGAAADVWGWREAFYLVGAPGLLLALVFRATIAEPPRGDADCAAVALTAVEPPPTLIAAAKHLFRKPTFTHMVCGMAVTNFALQSMTVFKAPFLIRRFEAGIGEAGLIIGLAMGLSAGLGTLVGGFCSDWAAHRDRRWYAWLPALGLAAAGPLYALAWLQNSALAVAGFLILPSILNYVFLAPTLATTQNLAQPRMRATAVALMTLFGAAVGLALGPAVAGWLSDWLAARAYASMNAIATFASACPGGVAPIGSTDGAARGCRLASAAGIQQALIATNSLFLWAAAHFLLAARSIRRDLRETFAA